MKLLELIQTQMLKSRIVIAKGDRIIYCGWPNGAPMYLANENIESIKAGEYGDERLLKSNGELLIDGSCLLDAHKFKKHDIVMAIKLKEYGEKSDK